VRSFILLFASCFSEEETAAWLLNQLHGEIHHHYSLFTANPSYVLPRHSYLFLQRILPQRLTMSYDYLKCWLRSVREARNILLFQDTVLRTSSAQFFTMFHQGAATSHSQSSSDESFHPSDDTSVNTSLTASLTDYCSSIDTNSTTSSPITTVCALTGELSGTSSIQSDFFYPSNISISYSLRAHYNYIPLALLQFFIRCLYHLNCGKV
jgi:hypothetical protein